MQRTGRNRDLRLSPHTNVSPDHPQPNVSLASARAKASLQAPSTPWASPHCVPASANTVLMPVCAGGCLSTSSGGGDAHSSPDANFPSALQTSGRGHVTGGGSLEDVFAKLPEGAGQSSLGAPLALTSGPSTCSPPKEGVSERPALNL